MPLSPGDKLGPYEIVEPIGQGGMGAVYRAHDTRLGRDVAIKVSAQKFSERFEREARVISSLNHPNICHLYDVGDNYLVMELVEGQTLSDRIKQGAIPLEESLDIARQIAAALEAAHEKGVVHRDLKPGNVMLRADGPSGSMVKVLDFGLAKVARTSQSASDGDADPELSPTISMAATQAGVVLGTAAYMAPEQAKGKPVDKRADIWAFGVVLYEMVTGKRLFAGDDLSETLASVIKDKPDLSEVPPELHTLLTKCLEKDPKKRLRDVSAVELLLEAGQTEAKLIANQLQASARPAPEGGLKSVPPLVWAGVAAAVVIAVIATWALKPVPEPQPGKVARFSFLVEGRQFTNTPSSVVAMSPDGTKAAYLADGQLFIRNLNEMTAHPTGVTNIAQPVFSPDSQSIVYFSPQDNLALKRVPVSGGTPLTIWQGPGGTVAPRSVWWGPDDVLLFSQPEGIMRLPAMGGTPELVLAAVDDEEFGSPQFLPDSDTLLFCARPADGAWDDAVIAVETPGKKDRKMIWQGSAARYVPTGHLVFAQGTTLWAMLFDVDRLESRGTPVPLQEGLLRSDGGPTDTANYDFSRDGTFVYRFDDSAGGGSLHLSWVNRRTKAVERIDTVPRGDYSSLGLSPDGTQVAVVDGSVNGALRVYQLATGRSTLLASRVTGAASPIWDPLDGSRLAYSMPSQSLEDVVIGAADGSGEPRPVTDIAGRVHPDAWSPDGKTLLVHRHQGADLLTVDLGTLNGEEPLPGKGYLERTFVDRMATFSPDGSWVAYASNKSGQNQVYVSQFPDPGGEFPVSPEGCSGPKWRGREIFFRCGDRFMAVEVTTSPALQVGTPVEIVAGLPLVSRNSIAEEHQSWDVTADGQRLLIIQPDDVESPDATSQRGLGFVLNWFEELKQRVPVEGGL